MYTIEHCGGSHDATQETAEIDRRGVYLRRNSYVRSDPVSRAPPGSLQVTSRTLTASRCQVWRSPWKALVWVL